MKTIFTIHAGEYLTGSYIEEKLKSFNVWIPSKDSGVDLLVTNRNNTKSVSLQVKFSKDFLITKTSDDLRQGLVARGWWTPERGKITKSKADFWILVLHSIYHKKVQFIIIQPSIYLDRLTKLHGRQNKIQTYLTVTKKLKCWETRGLRKAEQLLIAQNSYFESERDFSKYLNNWEQIEDLLK
jgi:hypothetical protein